jgi:hypothetical protein
MGPSTFRSFTGFHTPLCERTEDPDVWMSLPEPAPAEGVSFRRFLMASRSLALLRLSRPRGVASRSESRITTRRRWLGSIRPGEHHKRPLNSAMYAADRHAVWLIEVRCWALVLQLAVLNNQADIRPVCVDRQPHLSAALARVAQQSKRCWRSPGIPRTRSRSRAGQLDWWVRDRQEWFRRLRGAEGRQRWIKAVDLRLGSGSQSGALMTNARETRPGSNRRAHHVRTCRPLNGRPHA